MAHQSIRLIDIDGHTKEMGREEMEPVEMGVAVCGGSSCSGTYGRRITGAISIAHRAPRSHPLDVYGKDFCR